MTARTARWWGSHLLFLFLAAATASAQSTVGEISGYARDTAGAALPGVDVRLTFSEIGVERSTISNAEGFYAFPGIPNGRADLVAELSGFQRYVRRNLQIELNARMRLDVALALGSFSETVEVSA